MDERAGCERVNERRNAVSVFHLFISQEVFSIVEKIRKFRQSYSKVHGKLFAEN